MAYDFLTYSPGTDELPVDYSWLDTKRIKIFDINSYSFISRGWQFLFYDNEHTEEIKIMASKGKLRQVFTINYSPACVYNYKQFYWPVDSNEYIWSNPLVKGMVKDYSIKTFIYNIKKYFDIVLPERN